MQFPKKMSFVLIDGNTLIVDLKNQTFDKNKGIFNVTLQISKEFVDTVLNENGNIIGFEMEEITPKD